METQDIRNAFYDTLEYLRSSEMQGVLIRTRKNTLLYPDNFCTWHHKPLCNGEVAVIDRTPVETCVKYGNEAKTAVLMTGDALNPGESARKGIENSETELCICTSVYPCLTSTEQGDAFYTMNARVNQSVYTDRVLYVREVPVIKTKSGKIIPFDKRVNVDVMVIAVPQSADSPTLHDIYKSRIKNALDVAIEEGVKVIISDAFNKQITEAKILAKAYAEVIQEGHYTDQFEKILFTIPDYETRMIFASTFQTKQEIPSITPAPIKKEPEVVEMPSVVEMPTPVVEPEPVKVEPIVETAPVKAEETTPEPEVVEMPTLVEEVKAAEVEKPVEETVVEPEQVTPVETVEEVKEAEPVAQEEPQKVEEPEAEPEIPVAEETTAEEEPVIEKEAEVVTTPEPAVEEAAPVAETPIVEKVIVDELTPEPIKAEPIVEPAPVVEEPVTAEETPAEPEVVEMPTVEEMAAPVVEEPQKVEETVVEPEKETPVETVAEEVKEAEPVVEEVKAAEVETPVEEEIPVVETTVEETKPAETPEVVEEEVSAEVETEPVAEPVKVEETPVEPVAEPEIPVVEEPAPVIEEKVIPEPVIPEPVSAIAREMVEEAAPSYRYTVRGEEESVPAEPIRVMPVVEEMPSVKKDSPTEQLDEVVDLGSVSFGPVVEKKKEESVLDRCVKTKVIRESKAFTSYEAELDGKSVVVTIYGFEPSQAAMADTLYERFSKLGNIHAEGFTAYPCVERTGDELVVIAEKEPDGMPLEKLAGKLSNERAMHYMQQVAMGMQVLHEHGLPVNVVSPSQFKITMKGNIHFIAGRIRTMKDAPVMEEDQKFMYPGYTEDEVKASLYAIGAMTYYMLNGTQYSEEGVREHIAGNPSESAVYRMIYFCCTDIEQIRMKDFESLVNEIANNR